MRAIYNAVHIHKGMLGHLTLGLSYIANTTTIWNLMGGG